ncbi:MAG TPA: proton-conducting transporter membrane subunit, partial [Aggregatilineales bacterium]|nr:proton-conducting transporter membrane subunit [Aggregatilineales bacterium]
MGGLFDRIPLTAIALLAGGLSLAGFPLVTAGFWSKDEILADALLVGTSDGIFWLHIVVFVALVMAATLTAFYTGRLWLLTFWGKPRTDAARHATLKSGHYVHEDKLAGVAGYNHWRYILEDDEYVSDELKGKSRFQKFIKIYEDSFPIQLPLLLLAFFAITAGWVGIHPDFIVLKWLTGGNNFFADFLEPTLAESLEHVDFNLIPVLFSFAAAGLGLGAAWYVYGMQPVEAGEKDPVHRWIGDNAWNALQNRFYLDTVFLRIFYIPFEWFGRRFTYEEVDKKNIDELLTSVAQGAIMIGEAVKRFNFVVIDGVGDGIPRAIMDFSRWFRNIQSGRAQQYMLYAALAVLAIGTLLVIQAQL